MDDLSPTGRSAVWHAQRIGAVFPNHYPIFRDDGVRCSCGRADCKNVGKHPMWTPVFQDGFHSATRDVQVIAAHWRRRPQSNLGLAVPPGYFVLDFDPRSGGDEAAAEIEHNHGPIPETCVVLSGRGDGGRHVYFRRPPGTLVGTRLPKGVDLKDGGKSCITLPGSIHAATGKPYRWAPFGPPAPCPDWLWRMLRAAPPRRPAPRPLLDNGEGAARSNDGLVDWLAGQGEGNRNNALFWACCRAAERGAPQEVFDQLVDVAVSIGLPLVDAQRAARSAQQRVGVAA